MKNVLRFLKAQLFVEDKEFKKYRIDQDTLLHELPEAVVNEFLDFLGTDNNTAI